MGRDTEASRQEGGAGVPPSRSPVSLLTVEQLERVRTRDPAALGALFDAYIGRIYGLAMRMTGDRAAAEDVTQETFLKVHRAAHQLDPARDPGPWLEEGGKLGGIVGIGLVDAIDPVAVLHAGELRSEKSHRRAVAGIAHVPGADVGMHCGEFADHLGDEVVEFPPARDPGQERFMPLADRLPIDPVHVRVVKVVPVQAPGIDEHLAPLVSRAHVDREPRKADRRT